MTRLTVHEYGIKLAQTAALRGDCTRRQVGAVIFSKSGRVIGTGYNGYPSGDTGCLAGGCARGKFSHDQIAPDSPYVGGDIICNALHAEENVLLLVGLEDSRDGTLYVSAKPCPNCERFISGAFLAEVYYPDDDGNPVRL